MSLIDQIRAKAQKVEKVNGITEYFTVSPPIRLRSIFSDQIFHVMQLDLINENHPLLYMAETKSWYSAGSFKIDE